MHGTSHGQFLTYKYVSENWMLVASASGFPAVNDGDTVEIAGTPWSLG